MTWDEFRAEAAPIIRERWHQGQAPRDWHMGRDFSICREMHNRGDSYEEVLSALREYDGPPATTRIWKTHRGSYSELRGKAQKKAETTVPHVSEAVKDFARSLLK